MDCSLATEKGKVTSCRKLIYGYLKEQTALELHSLRVLEAKINVCTSENSHPNLQQVFTEQRFQRAMLFKKERKKKQHMALRFQDTAAQPSTSYFANATHH